MTDFALKHPPTPSIELIREWSAIGARFFRPPAFHLPFGSRIELMPTMRDPGIGFRLFMEDMRPDDRLFDLAGKFDNLEAIHFGHEMYLCDEHLCGVENFKSLKEVSFDYNWDLNEKGFKSLAKIPGLESLELNKVLRSSTQPKLLEVFSSSRSLRHVTVSTGSLNAQLLRHLAKIKRLNSVGFDYWYICEARDRVPGNFWRQLAKCENLRRIKVQASLLSSEGQDAIPTIGNIEEISVFGLIDDYSRVRFLEKMVNLKKIRISVISKLVEPCLSRLNDLPKLVSIDFEGSELNDQDLGYIAARFPFMKRVGYRFACDQDTNSPILEGDSDLVDEAMAALAQRKNVRYLNLRGTQVGDEGVRRLEGNGQLQRLDLSGGKITNSGLSSLLKIPGLACLGLHDFEATEETLRILVGMEMLESVQFYRHQIMGFGKTGQRMRFGKTGMEYLSLLGGRVTLIGIRALECMDADDSAMAALVPLVELEKLILRGCPITDEGMKWLSLLPWISDLDLTDTAITDVGLCQLGSLCNLERLKLGGTNVNGEGMAKFSKFQTLYEVDLARSRLNDDGMAHVCSNMRLSQIDLSDTEISDAGLPHLAYLPNITNLSLAGTMITGTGLGRLTSITELGEIDLSRTGISDSSLPHLSRISRINLGETEITGSGLAAIDEPESVSQLDLGKTLVTDLEAAHLSRFTNLRRLSLAHTLVTDACARRLIQLPRLISLDFGGTLVSDVSLSALSSIINMEWLALDSTNVGDKCVPHVLQMKGLKHLNLAKTNVTDSAKDLIRRELPGCEVF